jgi:enamine deaminase RidA (YjgF/YER057c/UK114 family)
MPDITHYSTMRKLELEYYHKYAPKLVAEPPASTLIQPLNLASPNMMIEIDAIGFLPNANSIK